MSQLQDLYKYVCTSCQYGTNVKQAYQKHCKCMRHKKTMNTCNEREYREYKYECKTCKKLYKEYHSFYYHKRVCNVTIKDYNSNSNPKPSIEERLDQTNELLNTIIQNNLVVPPPPPQVTNNVTNNITNNITINVLNSSCKNVTNVDNLDIVSAFKLDRRFYGSICESYAAYYEQLISKFASFLNTLPLESRPIHYILETNGEKNIFFYMNDKWNVENYEKFLRNTVHFSNGYKVPQSSVINVFIKWDETMIHDIDDLYKDNERICKLVKQDFKKASTDGSIKMELGDGVFGAVETNHEKLKSAIGPSSEDLIDANRPVIDIQMKIENK